MIIPIETKRKLYSAMRDAKMKDVIVDMDLVKNPSEAKLLTAIVEAFGKSPAGFIYQSPSRAGSTLRPPDVVLCHPEVGILVMEAKGHTIDKIEGIQAGSIFISYQGRIKPKNVLQQVEDQMFEIKNDARKLLRNKGGQLPLMSSVVAFPNISESEWVERGYDKDHPLVPLLFKEHMEDVSRLKKRIAQVVVEGMKNAKKAIPLSVSQIGTLYKVFGKSSAINNSRPRRAFVEEEKLGDYIDELAVSDKYLSREQETLSRMSFEGTPRQIRGVAGSGKSIVLANIVARFLHRKLSSLEKPNFPDMEISIAVTCYNRALVDFLKQKIRYAFKEQTLTEDIPSRILEVSHLNGLMWKLKERGWPLEYIPFKILKEVGNVVWAQMYREQIQKLANSQPELYHSLCFDALFVDEGQDFEPEEYQLMLDLIRPHEVTGEKPIIIFYDDAQNIYGKARPNWREIGLNLVGERSKVMSDCFRNTRQIVELAFNVLLGSQSPPDTKVETRTYADINYLKKLGVVKETGDYIRIGFAEKEYKRPEVKDFQNRVAEIEWLSQEIVNLITFEKVRPEDILVVFFRPETFEFKQLEQQISRQIPDLRYIHPFGGNSFDKDKYIFQTDCLTISTVNGAKGYDAPIVFLVGADRFDSNTEGRASFYVAATRAKLLLYVSGVTCERSLLSESKDICKML